MATKLFQLVLVLSIFCVSNILGQEVPDRPNIALTGARLRGLRVGQNPELLQFAAMFGETAIVVIDGPDTVAAAQENVNLYINCLPWLQRFPGAELRWRFLALTSDFLELPSRPNEIILVPPGNADRRIGGDFNEWLNITGTIIVASAQSASTGRYACEACYGLGTAFEECHRANISVQIIGGPPFLDSVPDDAGPDEESPDEIVYRIGADFCIPQNFEGSIVVRCAVINENSPNVRNISQAFPPPDRAWELDGDLLFRGDPDIRDNMDFFMGQRSILFPDVLVPTALTVVPSGINQGGLEFDLSVTNSSMLDGLSDEAFEARRRELRELATRAILGTWTCSVNNTFGSDTASSTIRRCGFPPSFRGCSAPILFPGAGSVVPVGCTVCIPEGVSVTLDCGIEQSDTDVMYEWRDSDGELVSDGALFITDTNDTYTCTASDLDNDPAVQATVLAYSTSVSYNSLITERFTSTPRADNGCSRLSDQTGLENVDACVFVGETLSLTCSTDDAAMAGLDITSPDGTVTRGALTVGNVTTADEGAYTCSLRAVNPGPCGAAEFTMNVQVFDPARIDRVSDLNLGCVFGAGRQNMAISHPSNSTVRICCPYSGIEMPTTTWYRVVVDQNGCAREMELSGATDTGSSLDIDVIYQSDGETYVCRTSNRAGADADVVALRSTVGNEWVAGEFSSCNFRCRDGVRTRSVYCRSRIDGMIVPDTECSLIVPRPLNVESCADDFPNECYLFPVWIPGEWSQCTSECGGIRHREVNCQVIMTGEIRPNSDCGAQAKPAVFDFVGCQQECCLKDTYPAYCRSNGPGYCADEAFSNYCCWTCGRKTIAG